MREKPRNDILKISLDVCLWFNEKFWFKFIKEPNFNDFSCIFLPVFHYRIIIRKIWIKSKFLQKKIYVKYNPKYYCCYFHSRKYAYRPQNRSTFFYYMKCYKISIFVKVYLFEKLRLKNSGKKICIFISSDTLKSIKAIKAKLNDHFTETQPHMT